MISRVPSLGIVTPSFQQGGFVRATLESVARNHFPSLRLDHRVLDGGSRDESVRILRAFRPRVWWRSRRDRGQIDALNQGFALVKGEIMGFLNADDLYTPGTLREVLALFAQHPDVMWITGDYQVIDAQGKLIQSWMTLYKRLQRQVLQWFPSLFPLVLAVNNPLSQPSTFWRREVWEQVGAFSEGYPLAFDYDWWWRVYTQCGPPLVVPYVWSAFRVHQDSKGGQQFATRLEEQWRVAKDHGVSRVLLAFHRFHNQVAVRVYAWLTR